MPQVQLSSSRQDSARIIRVVKKDLLKHIDQDKEDLQFWLSKTVRERAAAVTSIILQSLTPGRRLNKSYMLQRSSRTRLERLQLITLL